MEPRVDVAEGTAFEVLLGAAAIADPDWRDVFATGPEAYIRADSIVGSDFVRRVAAFGRYGWINLIGLIASTQFLRDLGHLVEAVRECRPEELHYVAVGGDRRQLVRVVDPSAIRAALAGDPASRRSLVSALASDELVLEASAWLVNTSSVDVHRAALEVLQTWQERLLRPADEAALSRTLHEHAESARARLATTTSRTYLELTIGGLDYDPAGLDRVLAVSSPGVAPIIVVVDGRTQTVILHPPTGTSTTQPDRDERLLELSRAIGDKTRLRLLARLREREMTAVALAESLGAPRTTLLHHLAILRAAGVIHVTVTPGGATIYRLRIEGFQELSRSAADFIPTE